MPNLRFVVINVSYFSLGFQVADGVEKWRDYYYSQFWDIDFVELDKFDLKRYSKIVLYTPRVAFSYLKQGFHVTLTADYLSNGFLKPDTIGSYKNISYQLGAERVSFHDRLYRESRCKQNEVDLEQLVSEIKKRKITPVIVTPPVLSTYFKFVNQEKQKKMHDVINALCLKYQCKYYDYFTDSRFVQGDFIDNDHLNFVGAKKFSTIINDEILERK